MMRMMTVTTELGTTILPIFTTRTIREKLDTIIATSSITDSPPADLTIRYDVVTVSILVTKTAYAAKKTLPMTLIKPKKDFLVIEHIHSQSILSSIDEVKLLIEERSIDVLCVIEIWLLPHTPDNFINAPNFKVFRCDKGRGAGACIYVRNTQS